MLHSAYRSKIHVLDGGERIPLLIDTLTGLPDQFTADYSLANHRGKSIATTKQAVDAIGMFKSWARTQGIDLDHRLSSFLLLSSDELTSLAEHLSLNRRTRLKGGARSVVGATQASLLCHLNFGPFRVRVFHRKYPWLGEELRHEGIEVHGRAEGVRYQAG